MSVRRFRATVFYQLWDGIVFSDLIEPASHRYFEVDFIKHSPYIFFKSALIFHYLNKKLVSALLFFRCTLQGGNRSALYSAS